MMQKFWLWIHDKVEKAIGERNKYGSVSDEKCVPMPVARGDDISGKNMSFQLFFAEGGVVLQRYQYNHKTDRNENKLFLIGEDQDVAMRVGEIVSMEILRG
jgi:hypothetical protein